MSEQGLLKHQLGKDALKELTFGLSTIFEDFESDAFYNAALVELNDLELKQRVYYLAHLLHAFLPSDFSQTASKLILLKHTWPTDVRTTGGFSYSLWPVIEYVGFYGLEQPELALDVFEALTEHFSAEFAIRPFITQHFDVTYSRLLSWTQHENHHVRRLASEGLRPLLPWAMQLTRFRDDPVPIFKILDQLRHDKSQYVQKSVANNLNDIAKDHPEHVITLCKTWLDNSSPACDWIIKHGLRNLVKNGNKAVYRLLGYTVEPNIRVNTFRLNSTHVCLGDELALTLELDSFANQTQCIVVDYRLTYPKAKGRSTSKVFKWRNVKIESNTQLRLQKSHSFKPISTRRYYEGEHKIEVLINGQPYSTKTVYLSTKKASDTE
jgi:3-methyladenine DNA glycosylase AlkC